MLVSRSARHAIIACLGIGLAVVVLLHSQIRHLDYVPDLGDPLFSTWRIAWVHHQLVSDPRHLFDANIFYPERLTLTFSDPVILPALTASPLSSAVCTPSSPTTCCSCPDSGFQDSRFICSCVT
jgi:hypothetical protein